MSSSGVLHSLEGHIINHTMKTSVGQSGSPIIVVDTNGPEPELYAVGIHTHRGIRKDFNSGLYFNSHILETLNRYRHHSLMDSIKQTD